MLTLSDSHEPVTHVGANNLHVELGLEKQKNVPPAVLYCMHPEDILDLF